MRDYKFETETDAEQFERVVAKAEQMVRDRAQRQMAKYRKSMSPSGGGIAGSKKQSDRDSMTTVSDLGSPGPDIADREWLPSSDAGQMIHLLIEIVGATDIPVADLSYVSSCHECCRYRSGCKATSRPCLPARSCFSPCHFLVLTFFLQID